MSRASEILQMSEEDELTGVGKVVTVTKPKFAKEVKPQHISYTVDIGGKTTQVRIDKALARKKAEFKVGDKVLVKLVRAGSGFEPAIVGDGKSDEAFDPNIAAGSTYSIEAKKVGNAKISLEQDNGQQVVIHMDDLPELFKKLKQLSK